MKIQLNIEVDREYISCVLRDLQSRSLPMRALQVAIVAISAVYLIAHGLFIQYFVVQLAIGIVLHKILQHQRPVDQN